MPPNASVVLLLLFFISKMVRQVLGKILFTTQSKKSVGSRFKFTDIMEIHKDRKVHFGCLVDFTNPHLLLCHVKNTILV